MASTEATSEESSAEELVASETEAKVISEDAEAADQSKHGATGGGTGVTDRVTDVYLGSNGFNIQYNQSLIGLKSCLRFGQTRMTKMT